MRPEAPDPGSSRDVIASGVAIGLAGIGVVAFTRWLGLIGYVYTDDRYDSNGTWLWIGTRGLGWLALGALVVIVGGMVVSVGVRDRRRERPEVPLPPARVLRTREG